VKRLGWVRLGLCCACADDHGKWRYQHPTSRVWASVTMV
jgi:hypothetical protein